MPLISPPSACSACSMATARFMPARRAGRRHSLHPEHDVDLLDRDIAAAGRQAVLVPPLRDEGPGFIKSLIERDRGKMLGAGADGRFAG